MSLPETAGYPERSARPVVVILGPTAVGKTEIAIQLAERLDGEIVSADSRLFYKGMDIGTAKPTREERARVPHHLVDVASPNETWSLGLFQRSASQVIAGIHARGRLPFLVGGTGQYLRAVIDGWVVPEVKPDYRLRKVLQEWADEIGGEGLHARLSYIDPDAAALVDYRNLRRTVRALEVIFKTGNRYSNQRQQRPPPYRVLQLGLNRPRDELYQRIDQRIDDMLEAGFVDEVRSLLEKGYSSKSAAFSAIGYREIAASINGDISLDEAVAQMRRVTRMFVRHQANWFKKNDPKIIWFQVCKGTIEEMEYVIRSWRE
ncbi:MAG: tRNA (adenosine(37)-N6)-dimethylallyltransferase MiaA [Anaerolineales bacterium]